MTEPEKQVITTSKTHDHSHACPASTEQLSELLPAMDSGGE